MRNLLPLRGNISKILKEERELLRNAFIKLNTNEFRYVGSRNDKPFVGGISYWFKQDEIHQATHVHHGPAFLPWHRELINRFETSLRMVIETFPSIIGIGTKIQKKLLTQKINQ